MRNGSGEGRAWNVGKRRGLRGEPARAVRCTGFGRNGGRGSPRGVRPARNISKATFACLTRPARRPPIAQHSYAFREYPQEGAWHAGRFGVTVVESERGSRFAG